jgi:hypothetical protein
LAAGPISGAGGAGGVLSCASGYIAGQFECSLFSDPSGVVGTILKYAKLAGATESQDAVSTIYELADGSAVLLPKDPSDLPAPGGSTGYQFNFNLPYASIVEFGTGHGLSQSEVSFTGPLAEELYAGMNKAGLTPIATNLSGTTGDNVVGYQYEDDLLMCSKTASTTLGTYCQIAAPTN